MQTTLSIFLIPDNILIASESPNPYSRDYDKSNLCLDHFNAFLETVKIHKTKRTHDTY